jgi:hypothetical protein
MSGQPSRARFRPSPADIRAVTAEQQRQNRDHDWVLRDLQSRQKYAGQIVAVFGERVWAHGSDHQVVVANAAAALQAAAGAPGLPSPEDLTYVVMPPWFTEESPSPAY